MPAFYNFLFWLDGGTGILSGLLGIGVFVFSIWMAVDCYRRGRDGWWIWIIIFTGGIGAFIYFITQYWDGTRIEHSLWQRLTAGGRIRDLQARTHHLDTAGAYEELGDAQAGVQRWKDAETSYREALKRDASGLHAQVRLGYALIALERHDEAWSLLAPVYKTQPRFDDDKLIRHLARCQAARGNFPDARNLYEYFLRKHSYTEVQIEYAKMLLDSGDADAGRKALLEIIDDAQHAPKFAQRRDRRWVREAKRLIKG